MGSDLTWTLALPGLTTDLVEQVLALAERSCLSPHRPDGPINGSDHGDEPRLLTAMNSCVA